MTTNAWMRNPWAWFGIWIPVLMVLAIVSVATHNLSLLSQGILLGMALFVIAIVVSLVNFNGAGGLVSESSIEPAQATAFFSIAPLISSVNV